MMKMNRRLRIATARHVKNRKARRAQIRRAIAYLREKATRELAPQMEVAILGGLGANNSSLGLARFIYKPKPTVTVI